MARKFSWKKADLGQVVAAVAAALNSPHSIAASDWDRGGIVVELVTEALHASGLTLVRGRISFDEDTIEFAAYDLTVEIR
jgi:phosphoribosylaminoimidazole (AIR) synthetase